MREKPIHLPFTFQDLLRAIFGKRSYEYMDEEVRFSAWKKIMRNTVKKIRQAIAVNLDTTDALHMRTLLGLCEAANQGIGRAKTKDELDSSVIEILVRIVFELLGGMPENRDKLGVSNPRCWKLDTYRKVSYTQTAVQRVATIFSLKQRNEYSERLPPMGDFYDKLWREFKGDRNKFLDWFKRKYTDVYLDIF